MATRTQAVPDSEPQAEKDHGVLYLGIDLGTSRTSVSASNGVRETIASYVGYPKDVVSRKLLKKDVLFGDEALEKRLALDFHRPLAHGQVDPRAPLDPELSHRGHQTGDGAEERGLAGAVGPDHRHDLAAVCDRGRLDATRHREAQLESGHGRVSQRLRSRTSTPIETTSRTMLTVRATSGSDWSSV